MPLPHYGVVIGSFAGFTRDGQHDFGHWYHGHLRISAPAGTYEAALDVDAPTSVGVSYRLVTDLTVADIAAVRAQPDGFHLLASNPTSGALDYVRSPLLRNRYWWAAKLAAATPTASTGGRPRATRSTGRTCPTRSCTPSTP